MSLQYPIGHDAYGRVDAPENLGPLDDDPEYDFEEDEDDRRERERRQAAAASHTPVKMDTTSSILTQHSRASIHVYIREDIKHAQRVGLDIFVDAIFGLNPELFTQWTSIIAEERWHDDDEVSKNLQAFCAATKETRRYVPLANIVNRVMQMAHGRLPDVPDKYPIDDICVHRNDPLYLQSITSHGALGAKRKPDLLTLRAKHAVNLRQAKVKVTLSPPPVPKEPVPTEAVPPEAVPPETVPPSAVKSRPKRPRAKARTADRKPGTRAATKITVADNGTTADTNGESTQEHGTLPPASMAGDSAPPPDDPPPVVNSTVNPQPQNPSPQGAPSTKKKPRPPGVRWVDDIMNWEQKGAVALGPLLADMRKDRARRPGDPSSPPPQEEVRGSSPDYDDDDLYDEPVYAGMKRSREDDDLIQHIRRPDPPGRYSNLNSEEALSYDLKDAAIQTGSYALETLACTFGTRLFCVNVLLQNDRIYLWYYDACGFVYTESISLIEDFEKAVAIFVAIARSSPDQLGALPDVIVPPPSLPYPQNWPPENLNGHTVSIPKDPTSKKPSQDVQITLKDSVFTQYILAGRRTFVYTTKTKPVLSQDELIVKFSYQVSTRHMEHELIDIAREAGVGHLPTVYAWGDIWKMSKGVRQIFMDKAGTDFEDRTLRAIIYDKYLPVETLFPESPQSIPIMAYQMMDCLHDLRYKANILHRDISLNNIMYEYRNGRLHFVLIDFDMATVILDQATYTPTSRHRTGTLAFMAVDLIEDAAFLASKTEHQAIAHYLCHDLESIFWLCLWCALVMVATADEELKERNLAIVRAWETHEPWAIAHTKQSIRVRPLFKNDIQLPEAADVAGLDSWFKAWQLIWFQYEQTMTPYWHALSDFKKGRGAFPEFDLETAGGVLTRDNLKTALTKVFPDPYADSASTDEPASHVSAAHRPRVQTRALTRNATAYGSALLRVETKKPAPKKPRATKKKDASKKATVAKAKTSGAAKKTTAAAKKKPVKTKAPATAKKAAAPAKVAATKKTSEPVIPDDKDDDSNNIRRRLRPRK